MNFIEAMQAMKAGKICSSGSCLYQIRDNRLMVQVMRQQPWTICQVNVTALMSKEWELHREDEYVDYTVKVILDRWYVTMQDGTHEPLDTVINFTGFAGYVYGLGSKVIISNAPMLFQRETSYCGSTTKDEPLGVLRPVAARFRR